MQRDSWNRPQSTLARVGDAFDILGLEPVFDIDPAAVQRAYLAQSALLHPDLAAADVEAARTMANLNMARRTLEDPERRADSFLSRLGGPSKERDKGLPDGFLMEMMETREQIEAAAGDPKARATWEAWAQERRREAVMEVGAMFRAVGARPLPEALRAIRIRLNAWRYIERLIEQLDPGYDPRRADFDQ